MDSKYDKLLPREPLFKYTTDTYSIDLRDKFATEAFKSILADKDVRMSPKEIADWCYMLADKMMKAREEKGEEK